LAGEGDPFCSADRCARGSQGRVGDSGGGSRRGRAATLIGGGHRDREGAFFGIPMVAADHEGRADTARLSDRAGRGGGAVTPVVAGSAGAGGEIGKWRRRIGVGEAGYLTRK